jgi:hypothetical protein
MMFLFANTRTIIKPKIISGIQNKSIEFNCAILANILGINNQGAFVIEMKIIP